MSKAKFSALAASVAFASLGSTAGWAQQPPPQSPNMTFFVTSAGPGKGADLGGLDGADQLCQRLAQGAGAGGKTWHPYLTTQAADSKPALKPRHRVANSPCPNFKASHI